MEISTSHRELILHMYMEFMRLVLVFVLPRIMHERDYQWKAYDASFESCS